MGKNKNPIPFIFYLMGGLVMYNKKRKLDRAHELANEKRSQLKKLGYDVSNISDKKLRSIKILDIKNNNKNALKVLPKRKRKRKPLTNEQKLKKNNSAKNLHRKKQSLLMDLGIEPEFLTVSNLCRVKIKDIENGNVNKSTYPFLFYKNKIVDFNTFDFNKVYTFPKNKNGDQTGWFIRWLDLTGESSVEEIINRFKKFSNSDLIDMLKEILKTRPTYKPELKGKRKCKDGKRHKQSGSSSSGRAGMVRSICTTNKNAKTMIRFDNIEVEKENQRKKRLYNGSNRYWQVIAQDNNNLIIYNISGHECLVILNTIFYNVVENERTLYEGIYKMLVKNIPEFVEFLPKPDEFYFGK